MIHVMCCSECTRATYFQELINVLVTTKSQSMDHRPQGFDSSLHTCLASHQKQGTHTAFVCCIKELCRATICIVMVWYTMLQTAKV